MSKLIGENNICPETGRPCLDECCSPGSICNLSNSETMNPTPNTPAEAPYNAAEGLIEEQSRTEESQEVLFNEIGAIAHGASSFSFYDHVMKDLKSKYTITRRDAKNDNKGA